MSSISDLLRSYYEEEPRRARGGVAALAGFELQIHGYLLDFVTSLTDAKLAAPADRAAPDDVLASGERFDGVMEALSDHLRADKDGTIAVQVKRTLGLAALRAAAREAVSIDRFLERRGAEGRNRLRFEVLARQIEGTPEWAAVRLEEQDQERFEALIAGNRLLEPRVEPDPRWRLVARVFPYLDRPTEFVDHAIADCLQRGLRPGGALRRWLADWLGRPPSGKAWPAVRKRLWSYDRQRKDDPLAERLRALEESEREPWRELARSWRNGRPIRGTIRDHIGSGFIIDPGFSGSFFLPWKQRGPDPSGGWIGFTGQFLIKDLDTHSRDAILSRKDWIERITAKRPKEVFERLAMGYECRGRVVHRFASGLLVDVDGLTCRLSTDALPPSARPEIGAEVDARVVDRDPATRLVWLEPISNTELNS